MILNNFILKLYKYKKEVTKLNCFIEYFNGLIIPYNKYYNKHNIKKVYLQKNNEKYGFLYDGKFFINDNIFDFKIKMNDFDIVNDKTNKLILGKNINEITYNIGFEFKNEIYEKYILNIGKEIYLIAKKDHSEKTLLIKGE